MVSRKGFHTIASKGDLSGKEAETLCRRVNDRMAKGTTRFRLNLARVRDVGPDGVRALLSVGKRIGETDGGEVELDNLSPSVTDLFRITPLGDMYRFEG